MVEFGEMKPYGALPVPHLTPELIGLLRTGRVFSLAVVYREGIPVPEPMVPYTLTPRLRHGDLINLRPASAAAEVITMAAHTGTHIDALCHIGEHRDENDAPDPEGAVYMFDPDSRGQRADESVTFRGQTHLTIDEMPPIVARGVLLDVAAYKGVDRLPDFYEITGEDIEGTLARQNTTIQPGTAVLIRTGFINMIYSGNPAYGNAVAGIGYEAAHLLLERGMILAGADNLTVEAFPPWDHPVHRLLLVRNGVTHLENMYLDELATSETYEFLLIVTPIRMEGATGSWVHPIALA